MASRAKATPAIPAHPPSTSEMEAALGTAYPRFQALVEKAGSDAAEWRRYTKNSPWVLKVTQGKRSLFYAQPDGRHVNVTVLLGQRAVEAALAGGVSATLHEAIRAAKAYPEGRPVRIAVRRASDLAKVEQLIAIKQQTMARPRRSNTR